MIFEEFGKRAGSFLKCLCVGNTHVMVLGHQKCPQKDKNLGDCHYCGDIFSP